METVDLYTLGIGFLSTHANGNDYKLILKYFLLHSVDFNLW